MKNFLLAFVTKKYLKNYKIYDKILNITILRIFYPYSEQDANFLIPRIIKKLKKKNLLKFRVNKE